MIKKTTFLLCGVYFTNEGNDYRYDISTARMFRDQGVAHAGIIRGNHRVVAFCDYIHGDDRLKKEELQEIARLFLDGGGKVGSDGLYGISS